MKMLGKAEALVLGITMFLCAVHHCAPALQALPMTHPDYTGLPQRD